MLPTRAAVRAPFDTVVAWGAGQRGLCLVTDAGAGWTIADLDGPSGEDLAASLEREVYVEEEGDVWRVDPSGATALLPMWVDDPEDEDEVAAFDARWEGVPDLLLGADPRLLPPLARQTLVMPTPDEEDLHAVLTGMAVAVTLVDLDGWSVVAAGSPDENLVPVAAGLTVPRKRSALVLASDDELCGLLVVRGGRIRGERVWNRRSVLMGSDVVGDTTWPGFPDPVHAEDLVSFVGAPEAADNVTFVRAVLRREGPPAQIFDELVGHLGLGAAGALATEVLAGRPLEEHPKARRVEPADSFWQFLRAGAAGAFLDPDQVPWFSILCSVLFPLLTANLVFRSYQLAVGTLDGWGAAQLVGAVINAPIAFLYLRRVLRWREMRGERLSRPAP